MPQTETLDQVQRAGKARLYPSPTNPNWLVLRRRRKIFQGWLAAWSGKNPAVLDIGGRIQPYRPLIPDAQGRYIAVDLQPTILVNVIANAEQLPFAKEEFDLVLCTQMLEYATDPSQVVTEIYRVLRPGGWLLLSVPSLSVRDADEDRWRFWPAGIQQLLSNFSKVEIVPEGGSVAGFFRTMNVGLYEFARYSVVRALLSCTVVPVLNLIGLGLDELVGTRHESFVVNYSALARK